jgi:hypothetical protein
VTITIFQGRTLQNDTVDGKPLTQVLKEVTDGLSGTAMQLLVLLSKAAYIPKGVQAISAGYQASTSQNHHGRDAQS